MKKLLLTFFVINFLIGCGSTPYQSSGVRGGFYDKQLREDIWRVGFGGNGFTTRESAQTYWLYRCAELAIEKGYDGFQILSDIQLVLPMTPEQFFAESSPFVRAAGVAPIFVPIYTDRASHPHVMADIRLLKKPVVPAAPKIFDARELKATLEPYVLGRKCDADNTSGNVCPHVHEYLFPKDKLNKSGV